MNFYGSCYYFHLMAIFPGVLRSAGSTWGPPAPPVPADNRWRFLCTRCSSCHPNINVETLNGTQSTNPTKWPGLVLYLSITGIMMERAFLPLYQLSNMWYTNINLGSLGEFTASLSGEEVRRGGQIRHIGPSNWTSAFWFLFDCSHGLLDFFNILWSRHRQVLWRDGLLRNILEGTPGKTPSHMAQTHWILQLNIIIIIIITEQGNLRLAPTSPVQAKIQLKLKFKKIMN